jgi:capsular exopolysaccharide synthesis family protein
MSTLPTSPSTINATQPRASGAASTAAVGASIDPLKLLARHKWLLAGAAVGGGLLGWGMTAVLEVVYPIWKPVVTFQCHPPMESITSAGATANDTEMARFMQTQVNKMTLPAVLKEVVDDPNLQINAPNWSMRFMRQNPASGETAFDARRALLWLKDDISARVRPSSSLIELSFSAKQKEDATAIVGLVREKYMAMLEREGRVILDDRTKSLRDALSRIDSDVQALQSRRKRIIESDSLESVDERVSANQQQLTRIQEQLLEVDQDLVAVNKRRELMAQEIDNPAFFSDELRERVDRDPLILDIKGRISRYEDELKSMLNAGRSREHREYKSMEARISGARQNLDEERNRLLRQGFDSELDTLTKQSRQLDAQKTGLVLSRDEVAKRQVALTQLQTDVNDIRNQIENLLETRAVTNSDLQKIISLSQVATASRVSIAQMERIPDELSFPQAEFMIPLGIIVGLGAVGGITFLREVVDQRVKGPGDISLMPKMKLLGWIPDAAEDPEGKGATETTFRDRPRGIVAESFRQLRSSVSKRIDEAGHKTILVMSGMPGSGATSVVSNLALAMAAADKKVLVIDANFRRPALHRAFGVQESPGVADVLTGAKPLESAVQKSSTPNVDVLAVGSRELRVVERLAATGKVDLLVKAKAAYDVIILDVAPAVVAGDGIALANRVDCSMLVVRAMADKRGMVARIRNELSEARAEFLGVVVNGVRASAGGYMKGNIRAAAEYAKA